MSKDVTFLIGNGFDLNIGLKTRYTDFYKIYIASADASDNIHNFKREILKSETNGWKNWMDFEVGMGQQSKLFNGKDPAKDFLECFDDFVVCFNKYLIDECKKINWDTVDEAFCRNFIISVRQFYTYIKSVSSNTIRNLIIHSLNDKAKLNFIQFNYTNAFDELIKKSNLSKQFDPNGNELNRLGLNLHVHGKINGGYPCIGVNDESQIENEIIRNDPRISKLFIKPRFLDALQKRDANQNIPRTDALNAITESAIICTFGVSIGDSDKYWWEKIGKWLRDSGGLLVIFDICGIIDDGISPLSFLNSEMSVENRRKEIIERFKRLSGIDSEWLNKNSNKILVELDSNMFSFKLPKKENLESSTNETSTNIQMQTA